LGKTLARGGVLTGKELVVKRNYKVLGVLLVSTAFVITALLVVGNRRASGQNSAGEDRSGEETNSISRINSKAALLNNADETQIRELTDEVFKSFELDSVPAAMTDSLRERLVRAEVNYRSGLGKPVSEFGIVRMTNMLGDKLGAPSYFKTNVFEVRRLEMNFLPFLSKFIGKKPNGQVSGPKALRSSINSTMSPLEAFTIAGLLIQQKRFNPTYQTTQAEFLAKRSAKGKVRNAGDGPFDTKRKDDAEQAIQRASDTMSVTELFKLSHEALDKLGVSRGEGGRNNE
jgi:hypothetical protein